MPTTRWREWSATATGEVQFPIASQLGMVPPPGMTLSTTFQGFEDKNANDVHDSGERKLFTVEIDAARSRLIAGTFGI